jgi:phosphoribosylglycinamide formyltransferase-1
MNKVAIFASGNGTNAERIMEYFSSNKDVEISLVLTNNPKAGVIERAKKFNVPFLIFNRNEFNQSDKVINSLLNNQIDFIVLAGFLWLVPNSILKNYPNKIINIHPALLPKYGGKGMYGRYVHEAVIANNEPQSGISIHYVNEHYDEGNIIFQATCTVSEQETPDSLALKIHELEYTHFPRVIEQLLFKN